MHRLAISLASKASSGAEDKKLLLILQTHSMPCQRGRGARLQRHGLGGRLGRLLLLRGCALRAPRAHLLAQARAEGRRVGRCAVAPALLLRVARVLAVPAASQVTLAL